MIKIKCKTFKYVFFSDIVLIIFVCLFLSSFQSRRAFGDIGIAIAIAVMVTISHFTQNVYLQVSYQDSMRNFKLKILMAKRKKKNLSLVVMYEFHMAMCHKSSIYLVERATTMQIRLLSKNPKYNSVYVM